jgi:hypothetical protein
MKVLTAWMTFAACALALVAGCGTSNGPGPADIQDALQDLAVGVDTTDAPGDSVDETGFIDADSGNADIVCAVVGLDGSCATAWTCIQGCVDADPTMCTTECLARLSLEGQISFEPLSSCITAKCSSLPDGTDVLTCAAEKCPTEYAACFNPCEFGG